MADNQSSNEGMMLSPEMPMTPRKQSRSDIDVDSPDVNSTLQSLQLSSPSPRNGKPSRPSQRSKPAHLRSSFSRTDSVEVPKSPELVPQMPSDPPKALKTPIRLPAYLEDETTNEVEENLSFKRDPAVSKTVSAEPVAPQSVVSDTTLVADVQPSQSRIVYRLACTDTTKSTPVMIYRYDWKPFEGNDVESIQKEDLARERLAPIDFTSSIEGFFIRKRQNQLRETFGTSKDLDPGDFKIGVDFVSRTQMRMTVRIFSSHLKDVLCKTILYYPGANLDAKEILVSSPYKVIFHYWEDLQHILSTGREGAATVKIRKPENGSEVEISCNPTMLDHLGTLLNAPDIQNCYRKSILPERNLHINGLATYNNLWQLFRPGDTVFGKIHGKLAGFIIQRVAHGQYDQTDGGFAITRPESYPTFNDVWNVKVWNLGYDDGKLTRQVHRFYIHRYLGEKRINELEVFPIAHLKDNDRTKNTLIDQGKRYHDIICEQPYHMRYKGLIPCQKSYYYEGEVIIDHKQFISEMKTKEPKDTSNEYEKPDDGAGHPIFSKFNDMVCSKSNPLEITQYLLLPSRVSGYCIGNKRWEQFEMSCIHEVLAIDKPMSYLIIDDKLKRILQSAAGRPRMTSTALRPWTTEWSADFIDGKGRGTVVFLHGPPGTGKTMTVECITQWTRRPLISISAADLGMEEISMERRLMTLLNQAAMWGAIVLVDEAEVYLEQRQAGQINRNSLVTAFLRTMEYFPGLMFLTSNAIGLFDEAVMSRIHLSFQYERPSPDQRKQIWISIFEKLQKDQDSKKRSIVRDASLSAESDSVDKSDAAENSIHIRVSEEAKSLAYDEYKHMELNGRDIRNLVLSATGLARMEAYNSLQKDQKFPEQITVLAIHLKTVVDNKKRFREEYKRATGFYPEEMAAEHFHRNDKE